MGRRLFALLASVYAFAYAQMGYIMLLHMFDLFGAGADSKYYGVICSPKGIAVVVTTPFVVLWFRRFDSAFNLAILWNLIWTGLWGLRLFQQTDHYLSPCVFVDNRRSSVFYQ